MEKLLSSQAHGNSIEIVDAYHTDSILFQPTCSAWHQEKCRILGFSYCSFAVTTCSAWQQEKCRILGLSFIPSNYIQDRNRTGYHVG